MSSGTAVALSKGALPALQMDQAELISVLRSSLYPGAKDESIKLVISYCKAAGLDPMQKPVHIVPMSVKQKNKENKDEYVDRDVIMPGIGLYRVQAVRSGEFGGISEPEFGPMITMKFKEEYWEDKSKKTRDAEVSYPEWCRVTVKRQVGDRITESTAVEYWTENYATASRYTSAPNAMWKKRPRGQLAKCTSAQALRMAFPEIGSQPAAEEMEGKTIEPNEAITVEPTTIPQPSRKSEAAKNKPAEKVVEAEPEKQDDKPAQSAGDEPLAAENMKKTIRARMAGASVTEEQFKKQFSVDVDHLTVGSVNAALAWIREMGEAASK